MEVIATVGLTKYYGKILALDDLNLKIESGRCVGFLGPNGAGKSTTIKILCNLIRPTRGKAYVNGYDTAEDSTKALKEMGVLVETPEFYPYLTPLENLGYLGRLRGMMTGDLKQRIRRVLEVVKLSEWASTRVGKFSRGMKQRLGVAQAILHDPPILVLDEPSLGLDPRGMYETREIIKTIVKEGKTIFLASHMLREVQETCDSVALVDRGKLVAHDRIQNLESIFKARRIYVELLHPLKAEQVSEVRNLRNVRAVSVEEKGLMVGFEGSEADQAELLATLVKELGFPVVSFKPSLEALEEVYLQLVKEGS